MAKLYADENFPNPVVEALRHLGHDILTSHEAGNSDRKTPDQAVMAFAVSAGRAVLTMNRRDFIRLHKGEPNHSGIIVCSEDFDIAVLSRRIDKAIRQVEPLRGKLVRVNLPQDRQ